jgi:DNA (cytosine-5)-methyltransferase 1
MQRGEIRSANLPTTRGTDVHLAPRLSEEPGPAEWERRLGLSESMVVLDLFCGAGGMSRGFENEGFFVAAGIDSDEHACRTHAANFLSKTRQLDLSRITSPAQVREVMKDLNIPRVDVVVGGPPCQGFSVVGRARIRSLTQAEQREAILSRNELYRNFFVFVEALQPAIFIMENVQTMRTWDDGVYFDDMLRLTRSLGYDPSADVLNAVDFGVPQIRRRQFVVGSRLGRMFRFPSPSGLDPVTLEEAIGDLPAVQAPCLEEVQPYSARRTGQYQLLMRSRNRGEEAGLVRDHVARPIRDDDREIFTAMEPGHRNTDIDPRYRRYKEDSFKDKYYKLRPEAPSVTITAHMAKDGYRYIHYDGEQCRTLSVREAARIQSFDDAFKFCGHRTNRYQQIGNAVPPLLARELAVRVRRAIEGQHDMIDDRVWQFELPLDSRHSATETVVETA